VAGLTRLFTPEAAERLSADGDRLRTRLNEVGRKRGVPLLATGVGSILAVHWQSTPILRPADSAATPLGARALFHLAMMERGYYLARRGFISLSLALAPADFDGFVAAADDYCGRYEGVLRSLSA
jgi:glutamate-1-semialdehyde 2,1-aminomutase